jgi:hypothetical protein
MELVFVYLLGYTLKEKCVGRYSSFQDSFCQHGCSGEHAPAQPHGVHPGVCGEGIYSSLCTLHVHRPRQF